MDRHLEKSSLNAGISAWTSMFCKLVKQVTPVTLWTDDYRSGKLRVSLHNKLDLSDRFKRLIPSRHMIYINLPCASAAAEVVAVVDLKLGRAATDADWQSLARWDGTKPSLMSSAPESPRLASSCRSGRHQDDGHLLGGRRDPAMDRAGPRPEQKVAARSNRQQTPDTGRPGNSAHHYYPALLLGHNYNQLLLDAAPG